MDETPPSSIPSDNRSQGMALLPLLVVLQRRVRWMLSEKGMIRPHHVSCAHTPRSTTNLLLVVIMKSQDHWTPGNTEMIDETPPFPIPSNGRSDDTMTVACSAATTSLALTGKTMFGPDLVCPHTPCSTFSLLP